LRVFSIINNSAPAMLFLADEHKNRLLQSYNESHMYEASDSIYLTTVWQRQ